METMDAEASAVFVAREHRVRSKELANFATPVARASLAEMTDVETPVENAPWAVLAVQMVSAFALQIAREKHVEMMAVVVSAEPVPVANSVPHSEIVPTA